MQPPTIENIRAAREHVYAAMRPSPLLRHPLLDARIGAEVSVKHENHNPTGAFKVRGGLTLIARLSEADRRRGVISATTGNHGQSIAFAAARAGVPCTLVVPEGSNPAKKALMRAWGATLIEHGRDFDEARELVERLYIERGLRYVHSANEPDLIAGVGTYAMEVVEDLPDADAIVVPIGGGSLISGTVVALRTLRPDIQIIGVQAERASALARSLEAGTIVNVESADTFADGLATRFAFELPFEIVKDRLDRIVLVTEDEMREAVRWALETTHNVAEGAAAAAYAAAYKLRTQLARKKVVIVHSGHNIDRNTLRWAIGLFDA